VLPGVTVEAASPVLIEKVRSAVTDGQGRYNIVELRPGMYTVAFTLPGFSVVGGDPIRWTVDLSGFVLRSSSSKKEMIDVGAVGISRSLRDFQTPVGAFSASTGVAASTSSSTARKFSTKVRSNRRPETGREVEPRGIPE
jgi:hypothetical protein